MYFSTNMVTFRTLIIYRDYLYWLMSPQPELVQTKLFLDVIYGLSDFTIDTLSMKKKEMKIEIGLTFPQIKVSFFSYREESYVTKEVYF